MYIPDAYNKPSMQKYGITSYQYEDGVAGRAISPGDWKRVGSVYKHISNLSPKLCDLNRTPIDDMHLRFREMVITLHDSIQGYLFEPPSSGRSFVSIGDIVERCPVVFHFKADD